MKRILASALVLLLSRSYAQDMPALSGPTVSMAPASLVTIMQGKTGSVPLLFRVVRGYHINSSKPKSEFLIPTSLKIDAVTDIAIVKITYPNGQDMSFAFAPDEKLNVYTGDFQINVRVRPLRSVLSGKYMVRGNLKYQACDNAACYPPKQLPVNFEVRVSHAPRTTGGKNPPQSPHSHR